MRRCVICEHADCRCGMDRYEDYEAETATAEPAKPQYQPAPMVRVPDTAGDRIAPVVMGVMFGFLIGFTLGAIAVASGR